MSDDDRPQKRIKLSPQSSSKTGKEYDPSVAERRRRSQAPTPSSRHVSVKSDPVIKSEDEAEDHGQPLHDFGAERSRAKREDSDDDESEVKVEDAETTPLSKNQQKKLQKRAEWEAKKPERKARRKEARAQRKQRRKEERLKNREPPPDVKKLTQQMNAELVPVTVVLDCSFNELMSENELKSLAGQIYRCYSDNRKARYKMSLWVSSFGGALESRFNNELHGHHENWTKDMNFCSNDFVAVSEAAKTAMPQRFPSIEKLAKIGGAWERNNVADKYVDLLKKHYEERRNSDTDTAGSQATQEVFSEHREVVYLSSEGDETITELKPFSTYIIGGLVDRNRHKGICHRRAKERGVRTAKLPIGEYLKMASRQVLATNHVFEILIQWMESGDWGKAFAEVIPTRKGWSLKDPKDEEIKEGDSEDVADVCNEAEDDIEQEAVISVKQEEDTRE